MAHGAVDANPARLPAHVPVEQFVGAALGETVKQGVVGRADGAPRSASSGLPILWTNSITGTHGDRPDYVLASVNKLMDEFLTSYLRVNEQACEEKRAAAD